MPIGFIVFVEVGLITMRISRTRLNQIIKEETNSVLKKYKTARAAERKKNLNQRHRNMLGGDTMVRLAHGIVEEDEDDKESKRPGRFKDCEGRGQTAHDSEGRFSSKADAASHSLFFSCPEYPYRVRKGMRAITDPKDAGRGKHKEKGKGKWRVKDNTKLWGEELIHPHDDVAQEEPDSMMKHEDMDRQDALYLRSIIQQELAQVAKALQRKGKGNGCSWNDVLSVIKQFKGAEQYKPPKPKKV